jgi:protein O-GlcNAc transferase
VGLEDLVAHSHDDYIAKAAALAGDTERLKSIRSTLRDTLLHSPLTDARRFAGHLERAYRAMWVNWCQGESARHFGAEDLA